MSYSRGKGKKSLHDGSILEIAIERELMSVVLFRRETMSVPINCSSKRDEVSVRPRQRKLSDLVK